MTADEPLARYVAAADNLINLLNGPSPMGLASLRNHRQRIDAAMGEYDAAREAITGETEPND